MTRIFFQEKKENKHARTHTKPYYLLIRNVCEIKTSHQRMALVAITFQLFKRNFVIQICLCALFCDLQLFESQPQ